MIKERLEHYINRLTKQIEMIEGDDFRALDFIDPADFLYNNAEYISTTDSAREDIYEELEGHDAFQISVIYYEKAHAYLFKHRAIDEALEYASELGYKVENLTSETLASIHATQYALQEFNELHDSIFYEIAKICTEFQNELNNEK